MGVQTIDELVQLDQLSAEERESLVERSYHAITERFKEALDDASHLGISLGIDEKAIRQGTEREFSLIRRTPSGYTLVCAAEQVIALNNQCLRDSLSPELVRTVVEINDKPYFYEDKSLAEQDARSRRQAATVRRFFRHLVPDGEVLTIGLLPIYGLDDVLVGKDGKVLSRDESIFPNPRYSAVRTAFSKHMLRAPTFPLVDGTSFTPDRDFFWEGGTQALNVTYGMPPELYGYFLDALTLLEPFIEALTANSPILAGKLTKTDVVRRHLFATMTDDRTAEEEFRGKSSRFHVPFWIMNESNSPPMEQLKQSIHHKAYTHARASGLPEGYARLIGYMHAHPPLVIENGLLSDHASIERLIELVTSTGYSRWRVKPPYFERAKLAVEERIPSAQLTTLEKTAITAFISYGALALARKGLKGKFPYLPFSHAHENFATSGGQGSARSSYFWNTDRGVQKIPFSEIMESVLSDASKEALHRGQSSEDVERYLGFIAQRAGCSLHSDRRTISFDSLLPTGAEYIRAFVTERHAANAHIPPPVLTELLDVFCQAQQTNTPLGYKQQ